MSDYYPTEEEKALNQELAPMFLEYLEGRTTIHDWVSQMQYFADKHGIGGRMRGSIRQAGLDKINSD